MSVLSTEVFLSFIRPSSYVSNILLQRLQTTPGAHTLFFKLVPAVKLLEGAFDHAAACNVKLTNDWSQNSTSSICLQGTAVAQWLRCCATNWKVAVSIPDGVIGIFH